MSLTLTGPHRHEHVLVFRSFRIRRWKCALLQYRPSSGLHRNTDRPLICGFRWVLRLLGLHLVEIDSGLIFGRFVSRGSVVCWKEQRPWG